MALVTIQRSPSPSNDPDTDDPDGVDEGAGGRSPLRSRRTSRSRLQKLRKFFHTVRFITKLRPCLSESYFTVKGTALILPQSECARKTSKKSHGGDIQQHLQSMLYLLRHEDRIKVAVKLEQTGHGHQRYLALVSTVGRQDTEESVILGIDYTDRASVGLVLPLWAGTKIKLNGDGGFSVSVDDKIYLFKPVSVQAMWSALQCLQKAVLLAEEQRYIPGGLTHTWVEYYNAKTDRSDCTRYSQWRVMEGIEIFGPNSVTDTTDDNQAMQSKISAKLKEVMMSVDLDDATSKSLRTAVEEKLDMSLSDYKSFFDSEMIRILGQMDSPTMILDFLFLGSEWNASNLEELRSNGIGYILNVTREIDNFYTGILSYMNVRVYDEPESELLKHWEKTYKFINKARKHGSKVLVHCKMGISRSASTVIAYLMKENRWSLEKSLAFVQERRNVINPNTGFREQLVTYEGMLKASDHRHVFHSTNEPGLDNVEEEDVPPANEDVFLGQGLIHSSPDWAHDELASEEEILRSLKLEKGQGDNDDVMMEADLETGSRSTDSLEESLPDTPSPTPDQDVKKKCSVGEYQLQTDPEGSIIVSGAVAGSEPPVMDESSDVTSDEDMDCGEEEGAVIGAEIPSIIEPVRELQFIDTSGGISRIKPDNSWIKLDIDTSESTDDPASFEEQESTKPEFTISDGADSPVADRPPLETSLFQAAAVDPSLETTPAASDTHTELSSHQDALEKEKEAETSKTESELLTVNQAPCCSSSDSQVELGVKQYYAQEQIPWFPGTVRKIKQEISKSTITSQTCDETSTKMDSEASVQAASEVTFEVSGKKSQDLHTSQSCVELHTMEAVERPAKRRRRPVSVYEKEEIPLQQGLVRKTTLEIEEKHRLFSGEADRILFADNKPIQRSSSLKEERSSSKTRRSERRKTCGPILSPPTFKSQPTLCAPTTADNDNPQQQVATASICLDRAVHVDVIANTDVAMTGVVSGETSGDESSKTEEFVVKYGDEIVPLVKGKVKKQTQDFESLTEGETDKGGSVMSTSVESRDVYDCDSSVTGGVGDISVPQNIPRTVTCDKQQSKLIDRWVGTAEESSKSDMSHDDSKSHKSTEDSSPFNDETLALIREIGSVLVNSPAKPEEKESERLECSNVKSVVRQIELQQGQHTKKHHREIIIIEDTRSSSSLSKMSENKSSSSSKENILSSKTPSIVQSAVSVFGQQGFHSAESAQPIKNRFTTEQPPVRDDVRDDVHHVVKDYVHHGVRDESLSSHLSVHSSADRNNLYLNLSGEAAVDTKHLLHEDMSAESSKCTRVRSPGSSPRADSDHSVVKHLVGRFEKDVKSPVLEKMDFACCGGSRAGEGGAVCKESTTEDTVSTKDTSAESQSFQMRKDSLQPHTSESAVKSRLTRPKSADHAESRQSRSSMEQFKLKRQGNVLHWIPPVSELHPFRQPAEPNVEECRKVRCLQGKSHPLTKLTPRLGSKPFYNTM